MTQGMITGVKRFEIHDGPGIRTTVFLKGCPLRCLWCHNPETNLPGAQLLYYPDRCIGCGTCARLCTCHKIGKDGHTLDRMACTGCGMCVSACPAKALQLRGRYVPAEELAEELAEDRIFFDASGGGVTLSGGEPLMQPLFSVELLKRLGEMGIHTAMDTSLYASEAVIARVTPFVRLLLVDIKAIDEQVHLRYTGVSNEPILRNIRRLDQDNRAMEFRVPCIPECNMGQIEKIAEFVGLLKHRYPVKLLPYHDFGNAKSQALGRKQPRFKIPSDQEMEQAAEAFRARGIAVKVSGKG